MCKMHITSQGGLYNDTQHVLKSKLATQYINLQVTVFVYLSGTSAGP